MNIERDIAQIFQVYMVLVGDCEKTAAALDIDSGYVRELASSHGWADKVKRLSVVSKGATEGDWERVQNRALNFVQVHQLRRRMDLEIAWLCGKEPGELMVTNGPDGRQNFTAGLFVGMANALEKLHKLSYDALGDSPAERVKRNDDAPDKPSGLGLHSAMIAALNASTKDVTASTPGTSLAHAADEKLKQLEEIQPGDPTPLAHPPVDI